MTRQKLVIVGNGMAGGRLVEDLLQRKLQEQYEIILYGQEEHGSYNRILIAEILGGTDPEHIVLKTPEWYAAQGVRFECGVRVDRLDTAKRVVHAADGRTLAYDLAVLATGSDAFVPPIEGVKDAAGRLVTGAFVFRTIEDCVAARAFVKSGQRAVVIGGGLLGLEAAKGLNDLGLKVTLLERGEHLMAAQLDATAGAMLGKAIEALGIRILTKTGTHRVVANGRIEAMELSNGERQDVDVLVLAVGIRPRVELAREAGIPVNRAILVDDGLATKVDGVYAVGECAEHRGVCYGIVAPCWDMSRVLADRLAGRTTATFAGTKLFTRLKFAGLDVLSMGAIEPTNGDEAISVLEDHRGIYRKLILRDGKLIGAVLVGNTEVGATLLQIFDRGTPVPENPLDLLVSFFGPEGGAGIAAKSDLEICNCHHITQQTLTDAIKGGCKSMDSLTSTTHAGTGCGSCRGQLAALIRKFGSS